MPRRKPGSSEAIQWGAAGWAAPAIARPSGWMAAAVSSTGRAERRLGGGGEGVRRNTTPV
ncbi:hypothetical protein E2562_010573 [Oryza meyeriana var. granulata]|uniref:Uncharacterized protein n=1 Tax=Oryza meyeriana var. granulata TaxID=110450 RepID=A0A6G1BUZ8_9ORYZ|nr:hypothetical protein E2562_010573 [Oryza meyeriana var. granulata]